MSHAGPHSKAYSRQESGRLWRAGAVTMDDEQLAQTCRLLRDHGQSKKYFHDVEGYNGG